MKYLIAMIVPILMLVTGLGVALIPFYLEVATSLEIIAK
jgi:hypothetical protein